MNLKGTQTEKNIMAAFVGESQARNRYTYYASVAGKEGYKKIQAVFEETANHEKEHAKRLFKLLERDGDDIVIEGGAQPTVFGDTSTNLKASAEGEHHENSEMYPDFAKVAKEEGLEEIASIFLAIAEAEKYHERRFRALQKKVDEGSMFKAEEAVVWKCRNCGYHTTDMMNEAPEKCPACNHPKAHFEIAIRDF
ncbi:MAG: rubrerythrin family protein [Alphaproteobacteria bacterium]|jgi:rubrerythrin|nr:rubrerythrin family protein [Alphaproteobacteria bacterium]MCV6599839.1 rubrerythrin family protein [Alphaproteobacteria bacterium]